MGFSIKAAWKYKCPRCRQGDMFVQPLNIKDPLAMPESCKYCGQKTEPEVGFYYGAMMISYGISAWLFLGIVLTLVFYFGWTVERAMLLVIFFAALTYLKLLRLSRSLWLHLMEKHDPEAEKKAKAQVASEKATSSKEWKPRKL